MGVQVAGAGLPAATGTLLQSTVNTLIAPVVNAVGSSLLNVLAALPLNLKFAGADLWNDAVDCGGRRLVG
jgi:riboflavin transporter FmnP